MYNKIQLIKELREMSAKSLKMDVGIEGRPVITSMIGLKEAKDFVERVENEVRIDAQQRADKTLYDWPIPVILGHLKERW